MVKHGESSPNMKTTRNRRRVTDAEVAYIQAHPLDTAESLGAWLGRTASSLAHIRERFGRAAERRGVCWRCDGRPVWEESREALRMGLCKGCYLEEQAMRAEEDALSNAVRQKRFRERQRGDR